MNTSDSTKNAHTSPNDTEKKEYESPEFTVWGSVTEITGVGKTNPGTDMHGGSVNPPGHSGGGPPGGGPPGP